MQNVANVVASTEASSYFFRMCHEDMTRCFQPTPLCYGYEYQRSIETNYKIVCFFLWLYTINILMSTNPNN